MIFTNREQETNNNLVSVISEGAKIKGNIYTSGIIRINGEVTGDIKSENEVVIEKDGRVEADIKTKNATIAGYFKGEIRASGYVSITSTGRFEGNLIQENALLSISKGGLFRGKSMITGGVEEPGLEDSEKIIDFKRKKILKKDTVPQFKKNKIS